MVARVLKHPPYNPIASGVYLYSHKSQIILIYITDCISMYFVLLHAYGEAGDCNFTYPR